MTTFEEKYTGWIDGQLSGSELAEFERALANRPEAEADRKAAHQLRELLQKHGRAPALANPDFFNHQLLQRLSADESARKSPLSRWKWQWTLPRLVWSGFAFLLLAWGLFKLLIPPHPGNAEPEYFAKIIRADPAEPTISATPVYPEEKVTVIWLDGLDYLPASYTLE
jgi:hypothetical protein